MLDSIKQEESQASAKIYQQSREVLLDIDKKPKNKKNYNSRF